MPSTAGDLLVIGGAEDKLGKRRVLEEFVARAGGREARIAVIPTASSLGPEIVEVYDALFPKLGAAEVFGVRPEDRAQAADPAYVEPLRRATGIFMTGGNQLKLSTVIAGTPVRRGDRRGARARRDRSPAPRPAPASSPATWSPSAAGGDAQAADDPGRGRARPGRRTASSTSTSPSATATAGC